MLEDFKCDDEEGRARALARYEVLDTPTEAVFETIIGLVQQILEVPICAVSLVDSRRQWFKAQRGLAVSETPREVSFCTHTIRRREPFVVSDALRDPTFADNPLVLGGPGIRAYLGIPLITVEGYAVGSVCVIDTVPRTFSDRQVQILSDFARVIVNELELRKAGDVDAETGALSRAAWEKKAVAELRRSARYGNPLSLAIFDLDRFAAVNTAYGYSVGDDVIRRFADGCLKQIRDTDILGRFGGEEFVLLLPETSCQKALS
ncbi:MAG TPA: sensor domain-containing diguanylate cyclase, partial [Planctomycetaceae bacterium]|nr:sensor domain-containing diguanylate cyclase [Planctomycetaceae bacterium]